MVTRADLEGGGVMLAPMMADFVAQRYGQVFDTVYEPWCGPGHIGFEFLRRGLCREAVFSDISEEAIGCVEQTVALFGLEDRVRLYCGDMLEPLGDTDERFDLVVGNPPNYCDINPDHPLGPEMRGDLRPFDRGWHQHGEFYANIGNWLRPGALVVVSEINPHSSRIFMPPFPGVVYDRREEPPIFTFSQMIVDGDLQLLEVSDYIQGWTTGGRIGHGEGPGVSLFVSRWAG